MMSKQDCENGLPSDCWLMIFSLLSDAADLKAVSLTSKAFWANSNSLKKSLKVIHPQITMLSQHLQRFNRLEHIDLSQFEGDEVEAIREIQRSGISLEALDIWTLQLFEELMGSLRGWGSSLKALNWRIFTTYADESVEGDVEVIANAFPNLEQLTIQGRGLRFESSCLATSNLKLLEKFHISSRNVGDEFIIALSLNCVLLKDVAIVGSNDVTETGVGHLLRNRPNLESLSYIKRLPWGVPTPDMSSSSIKIENSISHAKALTSLVLGGRTNTDNILKAIAKAKLRLNSLGLLDCMNFTVSSLLMVLSNHHLTQLKLEEVISLRDNDVELLLNGDVSKLTRIEINDCPVTSLALFLLSTKCPSLVEIAMESTNIENLKSHERRLQNIPLSLNHNVRSLSLKRCGNIHDEWMKRFVLTVPNLKVLQLGNGWLLTSEGVEAILKSCQHITELKIPRFSKTELFVHETADDPELAQLNLEVLDLSCSKINDKGLAAIAKKCPRLVTLNLSTCLYIREEGIKQVLLNIKTLTSLNLMTMNFNPSPLLEWMLSTGNLASLRKIFLSNKGFTKELRHQFLQRDCLLLDEDVYTEKLRYKSYQQRNL